MEHAFRCNKMGHGRLHNYVKFAAHKAINQIAAYTGDHVEMEPSLKEYLKSSPENQREQGGAKNRRGDVGVVDVGQRKTVIIDVRTCAITADAKNESFVELGAKDKREQYARMYDLPDGVQLVPFAIDTYGRIGTEFKEWLSGYCKQAARGNVRLYNNLITWARNRIEVSVAQGVGSIIQEALRSCVCANDYMLLCGSRVHGQARTQTR